MAHLADRITADLDLLAHLPSPSPVLARLVATLGRADVELTEIEEIVSEDPVLAGQVVRTANRVPGAGHAPTASIRAALLRLGVEPVRRLALVLGLYDEALPRRVVPEGFWEHSFATASCAKVIIGRGSVPLPGADSDAIVLAALLHDLGLLVLASHYPREYQALCEALTHHDRTLAELEDSMFGIGHGAIGERLARHWGLPRPVCSAILAHHCPDVVEPGSRRNALIVYLADRLVHQLEIAPMGEGAMLEPADRALLMELGFDAESLPRLLVEVRAETQRAAEGFRKGFSTSRNAR
jgi:HD-like signal output (HDOD) protein